MRRLGVCALLVLSAWTLSSCTDEGHPSAPVGNASSWVHHWNQVAIDASGLDHTPPGPGEDRFYGEQLGPGRSSRAMAIAHIAIFEAVNAIEGGYESYVGLPSAGVHGDAALKAAIASAGHDALVALFPAQRARLDAELDGSLSAIAGSREKSAGIELGQDAASAILAARASDGSQHSEPRIGADYFPGDAPGEWRPDPISQHPLALGARWGEVAPFALESAAQFRAPAPPALTSTLYAVAFDEVKSLGGDGLATPTVRSAEGTFVGVYWAYDGMPSLCAPPRLYNQIAVTIADQMSSDVVELARLLALVNVGLADAGIAIWESKYYYKLWRPVTGIREADAGTGPTGAGDGNPATIADPSFTPLGAPASNLTGPNFTPPFPAYPSGHAGFGGALFQILRRFYGTDEISFAFVSDEFNGVTRDHEGRIRPRRERHFSTLSEAEEENGQSRIYLGIHWSFDKSEGIAQGRQVADRVFDALYRPVSPSRHP
jgi:hypothetical protein